ncbi:SGNH/GDSL hydrolase family protein [Atopococcus tabaci]|uniref:SGNH/GDSL hydrolase family protein n=1 Tax=Atopococcus tabaci TaxID=269774 RepID=UPI00240908E0|nr:SGNH/GDSL hydrolase family protein [Atopococcus tabaci]
MKVRKEDTILFIGDSVTDAGRNHQDPLDLGNGYPLMVAGMLQAAHPELALTFLNRGVGGDRIGDLKTRWQEDCLALNPDVVSILIGINDTWYNVGESAFASEESFDQFEQDYRYLLKSLFQQTDARVVLMEPFVLPYPKDRAKWRRDLDPRIQIVRKMAREYQTDFIPLDGILNQAGIEFGYQTYTGDDGVHPTTAGHGAIAQAWLQRVRLE